MNKTQTIIGIAGASGAGKSLLANHLCDRLRTKVSAQDISILNEDCYYHRRDDLTLEQRNEINYDHPDALEHTLLSQHLQRLQEGHSVEIPQYNYAVHNRKDETVTLQPTTILILEGILIFHAPYLRELLDLKVFVDVPLDICLSRRLLRDTQERGRSVPSVLSQYEKTVRPMFFEYIAPSKEYADLIVPRGGKNSQALSVLYNHLKAMI